MPSMPFPIQSISNITNNEDSVQRAALLLEMDKIAKKTDFSFLVNDLEIRNLTTEAKLDLLLTELQLKADLTQTQLVSLITGYSTSAKQDTLTTTINNLLTELQLKADKTETQPVSNSSLLTELQLKADRTETQTVNLITGFSTFARQDSLKNSLDKLIPQNKTYLDSVLNYQGSATENVTIFSVPAYKIYNVTNITCTVNCNATWQFEINNASRGLIRTTTQNKVETMNGDIWLTATQSLVAKKYSTSTLTYSVNGRIFDHRLS